MSTTDDNNNEQQCSDSGEMTLNKEKCTSCEQNVVDNITEGINSVAILDDTAICANCGKEGDKVNNVCNKCKMVRYCNAACKKKHRHKHKKDCEEHVRQAAELHDEMLFKQPPPQEEDCPICFLLLPSLDSGRRYMSCCGKLICSGCSYAPVYDNQGNKVEIEKCAFCRVRVPCATYEEMIEWEKKRVDLDDPHAIYRIGCYYRDGINGFPQDFDKALELFHQAGELGYAEAYTNIGYAYENGHGVEVDNKKAKHYYEVGVMGGNAIARHNLGANEEELGNIERALKHYMIAVRSGDNSSLKEIQELHTQGHATKEDYKKALQLYQEYLGEIKSDQRDKAAAADEDYQYY